MVIFKNYLHVFMPYLLISSEVSSCLLYQLILILLIFIDINCLLELIYITVYRQWEN